MLGRWASIAVMVFAVCGVGTASAQANVSFGRITAVTMVTQDSQNARVGGAIVGGAIGAAAGSGRSGSNRALGGVGGAFAGNQIGRLATQRQAFEYTILMGGACCAENSWLEHRCERAMIEISPATSSGYPLKPKIGEIEKRPTWRDRLSTDLHARRQFAIPQDSAATHGIAGR
jgi:hypothetical protein